jgi:pyruvate dehydrogenase E1 component alpha subunit
MSTMATIDVDLERELYVQMLRIRMVEEKIVSLYPEQQIRCPVHLSIGQEAIAVGVSQTLKKNDYVFSTHRSHAHFLAKGGNLNAMMAEIYGKESGCCGGKGGSMHLVDTEVNFYAVPILGSTIPMAVGTAFAAFIKKEPYVSVVFFGEAASEEGVFYESLNYASLKNLPVVFVCENNLYSVYSPLELRQPPTRNNLAIANAHGIDGFKGNGNNVRDVLTLTKQAVEKARSGGGPTYLEFSTYRWREHCGPNYDNDIGYRDQQECDDWMLCDPLKQLSSNTLSSEDEEQLVLKIKNEIDLAVDFAKNDKYPEAFALYENVFAK